MKLPILFSPTAPLDNVKGLMETARMAKTLLNSVPYAGVPFYKTLNHKKPTIMKPIIITVCAWICLTATQAIGAENLVENPDLSCDTNAWKTAWFKSDKLDKEADFITYVADQGANGTKGCLKMTPQIEEGISMPHLTGVYAKIRKVSGSVDSPAHLKVTFYAKAADQNTGYLRVGRLAGGGNKCVFPLSSDWEKFEADISAPHDMDAILFCPSDKSGNKAINLEVLLDEVVVEDIGQ